MPTIAEPLVHNLQTNTQSDAIPTYGQLLRHSCLPEFEKAVAVYDAIDSPDNNSYGFDCDSKHKTRAERLVSCRSFAWFLRHKTSGEVRVSSNACCLRWCPVCAQTRRNHITHAVGEWVSKHKYPKFITFTLKHSDIPLEAQVDRLYASFREIRRRKEFKAKIHGGVWFFQIKRSNTDGLWHPHLHCLVTGFYLYRKKLSKMWAQITLDSVVVDIRAVHDPQAAANDVARYASSPGTLVNLPMNSACELVDAMHGRRICGTWGSGRALSLRPTKVESKDDWQYVGNWFEVCEKKYEDPNAMAIINAWQDKKPLPEGIAVSGYESHIRKVERMLWDDCVLDEVQKSERSPP